MELKILHSKILLGSLEVKWRGLEDFRLETGVTIMVDWGGGETGTVWMLPPCDPVTISWASCQGTASSLASRLEIIHVDCRRNLVRQILCQNKYCVFIMVVLFAKIVLPKLLRFPSGTFPYPTLYIKGCVYVWFTCCPVINDKCSDTTGLSYRSKCTRKIKYRKKSEVAILVIVKIKWLQPSICGLSEHLHDLPLWWLKTAAIFNVIATQQSNNEKEEAGSFRCSYHGMQKDREYKYIKPFWCLFDLFPFSLKVISQVIIIMFRLHK